jgi:hypothetical protein
MDPKKENGLSGISEERSFKFNGEVSSFLESRGLEICPYIRSPVVRTHGEGGVVIEGICPIKGTLESKCSGPAIHKVFGDPNFCPVYKNFFRQESFGKSLHAFLRSSNHRSKSSRGDVYVLAYTTSSNFSWDSSKILLTAEQRRKIVLSDKSFLLNSGFAICYLSDEKRDALRGGILPGIAYSFFSQLEFPETGNLDLIIDGEMEDYQRRKIVHAISSGSSLGFCKVHVSNIGRKQKDATNSPKNKLLDLAGSLAIKYHPHNYSWREGNIPQGATVVRPRAYLG